MNRDARFYFANLGADITRCIRAAKDGNETRYDESRARARNTLASIRRANRPEAYEEGLLLLRALEYAKEDGNLPTFNDQVNALVASSMKP